MNQHVKAPQSDGGAALIEGTHFYLRSLRLDDEPRLQEMFARASPEDIHYRCLGAMRDFASHMAHKLAYLDPETELAVVASTSLDQEGEEILGAAHLIQDPNASETAEFDILVRSDCKQHGVGYRLMTELLQRARRRGLETVTGYISRDNFKMLQMVNELGFKTEGIEEGVVRVRIDLAEF
jgi:acetyltransferase